MALTQSPKGVLEKKLNRDINLLMRFKQSLEGGSEVDDMVGVKHNGHWPHGYR